MCYSLAPYYIKVSPSDSTTAELESKLIIKRNSLSINHITPFQCLIWYFKILLFKCCLTVFFHAVPCSIRPVWGPPIYLWLMPRFDTLGPTSRCSLLSAELSEKNCLRHRGSHPGGGLHGKMLFTGAAASCPNLRQESRLNETIILVTNQSSALKALHTLIRERDSTQDCCDFWKQLVQCKHFYEPSHEPLNLLEYVWCFFLHILGWPAWI